MSLIVGLALGAASVIALVDKRDVFGIFAANGATKLIWGVASAVLLVLALLPTEPPPRAAKPPGGSATADGPINVEGPSDAADPDRAGRRASGPPRSKHRLRIVQQWLERNERTRRAGLRRPSSLRLQA